MACAYLSLTGFNVSFCVHVLSTKLCKKNRTNMLLKQKKNGCDGQLYSFPSLYIPQCATKNTYAQK